MELRRLPLRQALFRLSLPLMGSMFFETLFNFTNSFWVGHLGTLELAAVNVSSFSVWLLFSLGGMVATGTNAVVAQNLGAGRVHRAAAVSRIGLGAGMLVGLAMALVVNLGADAFLHWQVGTQPEVQGTIPLASRYLRTIFSFAPVFCLNDVLSAVLRAHGDTRTPMRVYTLGFAINFVLDPLFIFGWGPLAGQGVVGAARASGVSFTCMACIYVWLCWKRKSMWRISGFWPGERYWLGKILRIGAPPSSSGVFFCVVYMLMTPVVGAFGPAALAALGLGHRVESLGFLICHCLSLASITLVGQNVGAGDHAQARRAGFEAVRLGVLGMLGATLFIGTQAHHLASIFSEDAQVVAVATSYLQIIALAEVPMGISLILQGVASGAGRPAPMTLLSVAIVSLRVPLARHFALTCGLGVSAVWGVISGLTALQGLLALLAYRYRPPWFGLRKLLNLVQE